MAKAKMPQVLTEAHLKIINTTLRRLTDLAPMCEACEECGDDCRVYREMIEHYQNVLNRMKARFFTRA